MRKNFYEILNNYYNKTKFFKLIQKTIYESLNEITTPAICDNIKKYGIAKIHNYFPVEYLPFLEYSVTNKIKNVIYEQIFSIAKNDFKIKNFYIDKTINVRIHYPFDIEKKSKLTRKIYRCLDLKKFQDPSKEFELAKQRSLSYNYDASDYTKVNYFRSNNNSIYLHSPHKDTWFGHASKGINFWWAITSVNKLNGLMLFKDVYKYDLDHETQPAYVKDKYALGRIYLPELKAGSLLIFDAEILHATRLNTSENTRLVISGRLNETKPKFYKKFKGIKDPNWLSYGNLSIKNYENFEVFKRNKKNLCINKKLKKEKNKYKKININLNLVNGNHYKLFKESLIKPKKNTSFFIKFLNYEICVKILNSKIHAFNNACPHLQFQLINSYSEKNLITCNGHGLTFNIKNGMSTCKKFTIKTFRTYKKNNFIYLKA